MNDDPSLKAKLDESFAQAYELAVVGAARETGLPESAFPKLAPYRGGLGWGVARTDGINECVAAR